MRTIRSTKEIDRLFNTASKSGDHLILVLAAPIPEGRGHDGRVAFIAGRRVGGAVARNRAKRVLREAAGRAGAPWAEWDVILMARPKALVATCSELDRSLARLLVKAGVS